MDRILHYLNHSGFFFFLIISLAKQNITTYKQEIEPDFTHNPPRDKKNEAKIRHQNIFNFLLTLIVAFTLNPL